MATIKFSEFDAGNINTVGAQIVGLEGGTNKRFTAADLVNGLATVTYVDAQDTNLQNQITQNTNDIANIDIDVGNIELDTSNIEANIVILQGNIVVLEGAVAALESNVSVNQDDIAILQGNIVAIENELANIADTDAQTLSWDGANANLSISNGNNVVLQEVLDNAGNIASAQLDIQNLVINQNAIALNVSNNSSNITVIQGQIADLEANGNIQTLSLDNSSNVLSISGGNTVDFTTVLGNVSGGGGTGSNYSNANVTAYAEAGWAGNIIPSANITYDLGTPTNRWKDLYLSNATIYLGDSTISSANGSLAVDGQVLENTFSTSTPVLNTNTDVYANNGLGNPTGAPLPSPDKKNGWYWISPGGSGTDRSIQWRLYNNAGPQDFAVEDVEYMYMVVDLKALGDVYFNIYTMDAFPNVPSSFNKRFSFALNGSHSSTGTYLLWAKPPGSSTTVEQVAVYQQFPRIELPFQSAFSTGTIADVGETIKNIAVTTSTSVGAGDVEFTLKTTGYKVIQGLIQDFNPMIGNPFDQDLNTSDDVTFNSLVISDSVTMGGPLRLANMTTTERDALSAANGDMIYNTTASKLQGYQNGSWINLDGT